jgi:hypothetical protein
MQKNLRLAIAKFKILDILLDYWKKNDTDGDINAGTQGIVSLYD